MLRYVYGLGTERSALEASWRHWIWGATGMIFLMIPMQYNRPE
jgi:hypothetical protein